MHSAHTQIIELFGLPRTGKTPTIAALQMAFRDSAKSIEIVTERASVCPINDKLDPAFNVWTARSLMAHYNDACQRGVDVLVADRGLLDAQLWVHALTAGRPDAAAYRACFKQWAAPENLLQQYRLAMFYTADTVTVLARERQSLQGQVDTSPGRIMNAQMLEKYAASYRGMRGELQQSAPIVEIDTTRLALQTVTHDVIQLVQQRLE